MIQVTDSIDRKNFGLWYEIFKLSSGRFISDPIYFEKSVLVSYSFEDGGDYSDFKSSFYSLTTAKKEVTRGKWKKLKLRLIALMKKGD